MTYENLAGRCEVQIPAPGPGIRKHSPGTTPREQMRGGGEKVGEKGLRTRNPFSAAAPSDLSSERLGLATVWKSPPRVVSPETQAPKAREPEATFREQTQSLLLQRLQLSVPFEAAVCSKQLLSNPTSNVMPTTFREES